MKRWGNCQGNRCTAAVVDTKKRASLCGKPATTERTVEGFALPFCDDCAAAYDAKSTSEEPHPRPTRGRCGIIPVDLSDPSERRAWLEPLRGEVLDLVAIGEDAAKPARERMFSRHEIGRRIAELEHVLVARLDAAEATLRPRSVTTLPAPPPAPTPSQGDAEEQGPPSTLRPV